MILKERYYEEAVEAPIEAQGGSEDSNTLLDAENGTKEVDSDTSSEAETKEPVKTDEPYSDFDMPEGMEVDAELVNVFSPVLKDMNLTQKQAQTLTTTLAEQMQVMHQKQVDAFNKQSEDWMNEVKADPELGGDNLNESISVAHRAIEKFGSPELTELLNSHGIGNALPLVKFMYEVGKLTKEDTPAGGGSKSQPKRDRVSILYPQT